MVDCGSGLAVFGGFHWWIVSLNSRCLGDFIGKWVVVVEIDGMVSLCCGFGGNLGVFVWWVSLVVEAAIALQEKRHLPAFIKRR